MFNIAKKDYLSPIPINKQFEPKILSFDSIDKPSFKVQQGSIISLLIINKVENKRNNDSLKTTDTNLNPELGLNYDLKEIKRFDEFNHSLSEISSFDLEKGYDEDESEFNSSKDDNRNSDDEEIIIKREKTNCRDKNDLEYEIQIEKEYEEIIKKLKSTQKK